MPILTPDQRLRVFISSTLGELAPERDAIRAVIERLRLRPVMFELGARPYPPRALYRAYLEQSHIFIGLYWERYGWVAPDLEISGLEDEYRLSGQLPRLLYVKEPAPDREPRLAELLEEMHHLPDTVPRQFMGTEQLADLVADDLALLLSERFAADELRPAAASRRTPEVHDSEPLPAMLTSFVGRETERRELAALLTRDDVRLVTLAGMGGIGKTRLAMEVGRALEAEFPDGVHLVRLAAVPRPDLVVPTIASSLGVRGDDTVSADQGLIAALAGRRMLLILDNFEHVAAAAPAVAMLVESCPQLTILVTSRRLLRLAAEHEYAVPTLSLPERDRAARPEEIAESEAVRLFVDRATAVRPDFRLTEEDAAAVAEICRRLDGVPLAIELAAARVRLLPPAALLARLDHATDVLRGGLADLPERQRSLRATLDWSHSLLGPAERQLFARLSTFSGGWTLEAAEQICGADDAERAAVLDHLANLVDNSLVIIDLAPGMAEGRFRMLEPVREYAREQLISGSELEAVDTRHLAYFEAMTVQAAAELTGPRQQRWLDRLEAETGNLGVAAERALSRGELAMIVDVGWNIWVWLWLNSHVTEARHWLEPVLAAEAALAPLQRARLHWVLGCLLFEQGHFDRAAPLLHASVAEFTELGDDVGRALGLLIAGAVLPYEGKDDESERYTSEAAQLLHAQGDYFSAALACGSLGMHWVRRGDVPRAEALMERALDDARAIDNDAMVAQIRLYQSFAAAATGDIERARRLLEQVVASSGHRRSDEVLAYGFEGLAGVALAGGDAARAATLLGAAAGLRQRTGMTVWPDMRPVIDALHQTCRAMLTPGELDLAWSAGHALTRTAARTFALDAAPAISHEAPARP